MAELKTKPSDDSVEEFLRQVPDERKRQDCFTLLEMMRTASGMPPKLWGGSMVGFGDEHYRYASGREGDWFLIGFSPRKQNLTLYLMYGVEDQKELLEKLGKHKTGKACLYINKLSDVDLTALDALIRWSLEQKKAAG